MSGDNRLGMLWIVVLVTQLRRLKQLLARLNTRLFALGPAVSPRPSGHLILLKFLWLIQQYWWHLEVAHLHTWFALLEPIGQGVLLLLGRSVRVRVIRSEVPPDVHIVRILLLEATHVLGVQLACSDGGTLIVCSRCLIVRNTGAVTAVDVLFLGLKRVLTSGSRALPSFSGDLLDLRCLDNWAALRTALLLLLAVLWTGILVRFTVSSDSWLFQDWLVGAENGHLLVVSWRLSLDDTWIHYLCFCFHD